MLGGVTGSYLHQISLAMAWIMNVEILKRCSTQTLWGNIENQVDGGTFAFLVGYTVDKSK